MKDAKKSKWDLKGVLGYLPIGCTFSIIAIM
jgi:hypothetical protein